MDIQSFPMKEQGIKLEEIFLDWKKSNPQLEDLLVMGFEV